MFQEKSDFKSIPSCFLGKRVCLYQFFFVKILKFWLIQKAGTFDKILYYWFSWQWVYVTRAGEIQKHHAVKALHASLNMYQILCRM